MKEPRTCPNCDHDLSAPKRLVATSAAELVEALRLDQFIEWCNLNVPPNIAVVAELEAFKDRMRANGYKTNAGPVKDAAAAFRTHLRNAVKFASPRTVRPAPSKPTRTAPKEL